MTEPIVAHGGVLLLPLEARTPLEAWPATLPIELDGVVLDATIVRFERAPVDGRPARRWTTSPERLHVLPIADSRAPASSSEGVHAILELPPEAEGALRVDGWVVEPVWLDAPPVAVPDPGPPPTTPIEIAVRDDRPDPDDPFEHWRWVLLAEELGVAAPDVARFSALDALVARHGAERWRMALSRLATVSPGIARTCRRALTRLADDEGHAVACWVADRQGTDALLQLLLDADARLPVLAESALAWADSIVPFLAWIEDEGGAELSVAVLNRGTRALDLELRWEEPGSAPSRHRAEPGTVSRVRVLRPEPSRLVPPAGTAAARVQSTAAPLRITGGGAARRFVLGPPILPVVPPGAVLPLLRPRLLLVEAERGGQAPVSFDRATSAQVRHRQGRWEIFVECRRPTTKPTDAVEPEDAFAPGIEALRVRIGPGATPIAELHVPETGWFRLAAGTNDGSLQVHRRSEADRWFCRIVLPDEWLRITEDAPWPAFGVARTHGDGSAIESSPGVTTPWRDATGTMRCDLSWWDE